MNISIKNNKDFVSICIPFFNRPNYIRPLLDSIHSHADLPFQLICHDDSSLDGATQRLIENKFDTSVIILSQGHQVGLSQSVRRCIAVAESEYIIFLNADCLWNRPFLKDVVNVLNKSYVGWVNLLEHSTHLSEYLVSNNTKFSLFSGLGGGAAFAFRKRVCNEINGFSSMVRSGCADCPFFYRAWKYGYFRAVMEGNKPVRNLSQEEKGNADSTMGKTGYDCGFSTIFNTENYDEWCKERWRQSEKRFQQMENLPENRGNSLTDMTFWTDFSKRLIPEDGIISKINWEGEGHTYEHNKWKDVILDDFKVIT